MEPRKSIWKQMFGTFSRSRRRRCHGSSLRKRMAVSKVAPPHISRAKSCGVRRATAPATVAASMFPETLRPSRPVIPGITTSVNNSVAACPLSSSASASGPPGMPAPSDSTPRPYLPAACMPAGVKVLATAIGKRELAVETLMSSSIFLEPVRPDQRSIFVEVKNTSEHAAFDLGAECRDALLKTFLEVDKEADVDQQESSLRGVRKAQVKLATYYLQKGADELARKIWRDMRDPLCAFFGGAFWRVS